MEVLVSSQGQKQNVQTSFRKSSSMSSQKDLWLIVREGSLAGVDSALALLKRNGGNINARNAFGLTPLHIAIWRNHIPIVRRLLAAGADPDARDGESGWSSLHRALHFGHLAVACILLQCGASITLEDSKCRTPIDLLSGPVLQVVGGEPTSELFSWGSGTNYQLGTGNEHIQKLPCKIDSLHGSFIKLVSASKFHSVAVSAHGQVYTWGFGRGGRLGHPDFDIHSGQAAVITPRQVIFGLGSRRVRAVAAAKHHTVIATEGGEVFTWGSNREGQLGYTSVDTQPTPRRVSSLRSKIVDVAAANKHTAVVSESGEIFTWGCNREGQLGYGTSNSASNYTPRVVEYLKGKVFVRVAAAKFHTICLGLDGEVYTWGHRLVTPRRVVIARNLKKSGNTPLKFHRMKRLHVVNIAAGMIHSMALTDDGAVFYWDSSDADLRCQQLYSLCGRDVVSISAGKYWIAAVTSIGDVFMWDGKNGKDKPPLATRLHGVKRATYVSVGETHLLIVGSLYHPAYHVYGNKISKNHISNGMDELDELDEDLMFHDIDSVTEPSTSPKVATELRCVPSLKSLCEKVAAESLVEPRNAIQLLEIADSLEADDLRKHCEDIAIRNLDYIFTVASQAIANASPDIMAKLEKLLDHKSSEPWSYRRLPTATATLPVIIDSEEEDSENESLRCRENHLMSNMTNEMEQRSDSFFHEDNQKEAISKQIRALRKKLQQIEMLESKQSCGYLLDEQQIAKLQTKSALESSLLELGIPVGTLQAKPSSMPPNDKGNKNNVLAKKHRRRNKCKLEHLETSAGIAKSDVEPDHMEEFRDVEMPSVAKKKGDNTIFEETINNSDALESSTCISMKSNSSLLKDTDLSKDRNSYPTATRKKKNRKGGLSMFLSGALDDTPKEVAAPPPTPKIEGPAWGGVKVAKGSTTLREIQDEQRKILGKQPDECKDQADLLDCKSEGKIPLASFLSSKPIPVVPTQAFQVTDGDRNTPPWCASGTPPPSRPSLRDIQMQQKGKKQQVLLPNSPKVRTAGFLIASGQGSPSDSNGVNRWFKPEVDTPSSIRSIQIEEKAIKDLKRFYSNVKIVKNPS
ncbi:uncharacterized protein LOC111478166 isoform X2 [Cucurbita maxima]|uniref:Uncharacterized protein LOC111478166 isoform X2 n=1 Tax=Cucurbita maxima TaxID=3661 RepID=A0A6J1IT45_CUCMA|nr:uncharacterized protein LOC111478166 isoform X2 [Cucurbita maxima]